MSRENDGREKDVAPYSATKSSSKDIVTRAFPEQMKALQDVSVQDVSVLNTNS